MKNPQFIPFHEWIQRNPDLKENCPECRGTGKHSCSCGHQHNCARCIGNGWLESKARQVYKTECEKATAILATATE